MTFWLILFSLSLTCIVICATHETRIIRAQSTLFFIVFASLSILTCISAAIKVGEKLYAYDLYYETQTQTKVVVSGSQGIDLPTVIDLPEEWQAISARGDKLTSAPV